MTESFNNPSNTTLFNATVINDGNLTITGMYHKADFDDGTLQGWTGGASTIVDGHLRTWGDSGAQMYVNVADFRLDLDLSMAKLGDLGGGEGFRIRLYGDYGWTLYFNYDTKLDELVVAQQEYDDYKELKRISFIGEKGRWYHVNIDHNRNRFTIKMDDLTVADVYISPFTSMTRFHIGAWWEEVLYDNVTIHAPNTRGHAYTPVVQRPFNRWWDKVELKITTPGSSRVRVSVMDAYSGRPHFPEFENMSGSVIDISELIPTDSDRLYLDIWLIGNNWNWPIVEWVSISWKPAPPMFDGFTQEFVLVEDTPVENICNLTIGTWDWYVAKKNLTYQVSYVSDPDHVMPVINGWNLSFQLPTKDWFGNETIRIACSDGEFTTVGPNVTVIVNPVNDPPGFHEVGTLEVLEDQEWAVNLSGLVFDVDTPIDELQIQTTCANCTVEDGKLLFDFSVGDVEETFNIRVFDGEFQVNTTMDLRVVNVNDAPIVMEVEDQLSLEEEETTVDLSSFLWDEDDLVEGLTVSSDDPYVTGTNGTSLMFFHDEWIPARTVEFTVTDGEAWVNGSFVLEVEDVNDMPIIVSVDGRPTDEDMSFSVQEASTLWLDIEVVDVDNQVFSYEVLTLLEGVLVHPNGTLEVTPPRGAIGTFQVTLSVDDLAGGWDEIELEIAVANVNDPPSKVVIVSPIDGTTANEGENVTFKVTFDDPDIAIGQVLKIVWSSNISGELAVMTSGDAAPFTVSDLPPGDHNVTVTVSDGEFEMRAHANLRIVEQQKPPEPEPEDTIFVIGSPAFFLGIAVALIAVVGVSIYMLRGMDKI